MWNLVVDLVEDLHNIDNIRQGCNIFHYVVCHETQRKNKEQMLHRALRLPPLSICL